MQSRSPKMTEIPRRFEDLELSCTQNERAAPAAELGREHFLTEAHAGVAAVMILLCGRECCLNWSTPERIRVPIWGVGFTVPILGLGFPSWGGATEPTVTDPHGVQRPPDKTDRTGAGCHTLPVTAFGSEAAPLAGTPPAAAAATPLQPCSPLQQLVLAVAASAATGEVAALAASRQPQVPSPTITSSALSVPCFLPRRPREGGQAYWAFFDSDVPTDTRRRSAASNNTEACIDWRSLKPITTSAAVEGGVERWRERRAVEVAHGMSNE
jgi:hypothetical protein